MVSPLQQVIKSWILTVFGQMPSATISSKEDLTKDLGQNQTSQCSDTSYSGKSSNNR